MIGMCRIAILACAASSIVATAQVPGRLSTQSPNVQLSRSVMVPPKLTRPQLINRLRSLPSGQAMTPAAPGNTSPDTAPNVVERETLSIEQMHTGAAQLLLGYVSLQKSSSDPAPVVLLKSDAEWTVSFRGSGNTYAIDCAVTAPNNTVSHQITQEQDGGNIRTIDGAAPLIDNHVVMIVPRGGEGKWVKVVFQSPMRSGSNISYTFHSCQILELV